MTKLLFGHAFPLAFLLGGFGYTLLEILWRGRSHISMFVVGGVCCCILLAISRENRLPFPLKCIAGGVVISVVEFFAGCVLNLWLGLSVWDYSTLPLQLWGQVSLLYSALWCVLSACVLPLMQVGDRLLSGTR